MTPRYPDLQIRLKSRNPFALVSAVRQAMRHSGVDDGEIEAFTQAALVESEPRRMREICASWAVIEGR